MPGLGLPTLHHPPKVRTYTFGCKVNLFDTMTLESRLTHQGCSVSQEGESPDWVVVNTCTVTACADRQARQLIRKIHRQFPAAKIVVTGCYAQAKPKDLENLNGVSSVLPIQEQHRICEVLGLNLEEKDDPIPFTPIFVKRTRAFLKMQDGCNAYCSFCVLPFVRGRSRSIPLEQLCRLASDFQTKGYREIVVTGTHLGAYGRDLNPRVRFSQALKGILEAVPGTFLRVSSLEPTTLTEDFIRLVCENHGIRPHFHIPLQSGSDVILRKMNRKYTIKNYKERIWKLSQSRSQVAIGTDVIVGFCGETEEEFEQTCSCIEELPYTYLHVFPFSARPMTRAQSFPDDVPSKVKKDRVRILRKMSVQKKQSFYSRFLGSAQSVLIEQKRDSLGRLCGYTPHYIPVRLFGPNRLMQREIEVRLNSIEGFKDENMIVKGEIV